MERRRFLYSIGCATGALAGSNLLPSGSLIFNPSRNYRAGRDAGAVDRLGLNFEPPCTSAVRLDRGAARLFVNDAEVNPFFALSTSLQHTADNFRRMGIGTLFPIIGTRSFWTGPDTYDWGELNAFLESLLEIHPDAMLFLRLHVHTPAWWTANNPGELLEYGLPIPDGRVDMLTRGVLEPIDGGHYMSSGRELREASFASVRWRRDTGNMLQALVRNIEAGPLRSRVMGYYLMTGGTGEWNTFGADFMPGYGARMQAFAGPTPSVRDRLYSAYGLLRDPAKEQHVIEFYRRYHRAAAESIVALAAAIKAALPRPLICGTFYAYLLEVPRMQEAGHLAPALVLDSPHIDLIAGPTTYQNTNDETKERWESDMYDGANNWLGRARGVGGDGAFRLMVESVRRRGKLFASEIDPSTYLDRTNSWRGIGGSGSNTEEGSIQIIRRDVGKVFAEGVGGWLYDFGPTHGVPTGWYGSDRIIDAVKPMMELMDRRRSLDLSPVAETAMIVDHRSPFVTRHWLADSPWAGQGIRYTDLFNHWFLNSQNRSLQRLGAPVDYLHHFDFTESDDLRYRLLLFPNAFLMRTRGEIAAVRDKLKNSGATVLWYYAPGLISDNGIDVNRMTMLTGFSFREIEKPGPLMITCGPDVGELPGAFGLKSSQMYGPRFAVDDQDVDAYGTWADMPDRVAFARREMDGWTSIFVGTAPLPSAWLRAVARGAGVRLWSNRPDVISGTQSTAMLCAQSDGPRTLTLPTPMQLASGGPPSLVHELKMSFGQVHLFASV